MKKLFCSLLIVLSFSSYILATHSLAEDNQAIVSDDFSSILNGIPDEADFKNENDGTLVNLFESDSDYSSSLFGKSGNYIWHIYDGMILCVDTQTEEEEAAIPLSDLYNEKDELLYACLSSWDDNSVLLCLCLRNDVGQLRIELLQICQEDGEIFSAQTQEVTDAFSFFFDGQTTWEEVNLLSCGQHILIEALDSSLIMHLYLYNSAGNTVSQLGSWTLMEYIAGVPCEDSLLLISRDSQSIDCIHTSRISYLDGKSAAIGTINIASGSSASNFAYQADDNKLFFTVNNTVYSASLDDNVIPDPVASLPALSIEVRLGAIAGDRFVALGENHQLLTCDITGQLKLTELHIADYPGTDAVFDAAQRFGISNPGYTVFISNEKTDEDLLQDLSTQSSEYDAFVFTLHSGTYQQLLKSHLLADISACESLLSAALDMPEYLRNALFDGDMLVSFPVYSETYCQTLNTAAMQELLGLSRGEIPTNWNDFLKLLRKMASKSIMDKQSRYSLYGYDLPAEDFQLMMFTWLMQDTFLWLEQDHSRVDQLQKVLTPVLESFNRVDWYRLGLMPESSLYESPEDSEFELFSAEENSNYVLMDGELEVAVMDMAEGDEFWPLSVGDDARLIPQVIYVLCVNPYSENLEATLRFAESVWENTDVTIKTALCQSMNEPVENANYEDDLEYMEDLASSYSKQIETTDDPIEVKVLTDQLDELNTFIEDYRKNAYWLITEDSIAFYRAFQESFVLSTDDIYGMDDENSIFWLFQAGELSPKQFAKQLANEVKTLWDEAA